MKKSILLAIAICMFSVSAFSQTEDRRGYISIALGGSVPTGDFASNDPNNSSSGYALTGGTFDVSFAYRIGNNFGVAGLLRGQSNGTDAQALANQLEEQEPALNWTVSSESWGIGGFMGGVYGGFPLDANSKSIFEIRGMIGFLHATSPQVTITGERGGISETVIQESAVALSFSYLFGAGFRYNISETTGLLLNVDYLGSNPEFDNVRTTDSNGTSNLQNFSESYGTVNITFGVAFRLR